MDEPTHNELFGKDESLTTGSFALISLNPIYDTEHSATTATTTTPTISRQIIQYGPLILLGTLLIILLKK